MGQQALRCNVIAGKQVLLRLLAWCTRQISDNAVLQYGLLAGGLADGSICLWNPAAIIDGSGQSSLLTKMQKHTGAVSILAHLQHTTCTASVVHRHHQHQPTSHDVQVKGLEFNTFSPNLLASGAADGELCIWDVANPAQPSLYPALKVRAPLPQKHHPLSLLGPFDGSLDRIILCCSTFCVTLSRCYAGNPACCSLSCMQHHHCVLLPAHVCRSVRLFLG